MWDTLFLYGIASFISKIFKRKEESDSSKRISSIREIEATLVNKQLEEELERAVNDPRNYDRLREIIKPIYDSMSPPVDFDSLCIYWSQVESYKGEKRKVKSGQRYMNIKRIMYILMTRRGYLPEFTATFGFDVDRNDPYRTVLDYGRKMLRERRSIVYEGFSPREYGSGETYEDGAPGTFYFNGKGDNVRVINTRQ